MLKYAAVCFVPTAPYQHLMVPIIKGRLKTIFQTAFLF